MTDDSTPIVIENLRGEKLETTAEDVMDFLGVSPDDDDYADVAAFFGVNREKGITP